MSRSWFLFVDYYTDLCTRRSIKKQLIVSFGEQFKKSHENLKKIIFQPRVSDLDQKKCSKYCCCYTGLDAITTSFVEHFKENQENITCVYLALIILWQQEYYIVKQILHGIMNSYFYVDSTATMLTAR